MISDAVGENAIQFLSVGFGVVIMKFTHKCWIKAKWQKWLMKICMSYWLEITDVIHTDHSDSTDMHEHHTPWVSYSEKYGEGSRIMVTTN